MSVVNSAEFYYWRQYTGTIPLDAVIGGESSGKPTYIGQVPVLGESGIHPAIIYPKNRAAYSCINGKSYWEQKHVTILCSNRQGNLRWVKSTTSNFVADKAVVGGFLKNHLAFIGRTHFQNDIVVGKVVPSGMYFPSADGTERRVDYFELLMHT